MNINEQLKNQLITEFKSISNVKKLVEKKEIYKFKKYNINQLNKIFNINNYSNKTNNNDKNSKNNNNLFNEINSKKHLIKIQEMIKSYFYSNLTNNYLNLLFEPTNKINDLIKRKENLNLINFNYDKINSILIKEIIQNLELLNFNLNFNNFIISNNKEIVDYLYEKFKLNINYFSNNELELYLEGEIDKNIIIVSNDDLFIDLPIYSLKNFEKIITGKIIFENKEKIKNLIKIISEIKDYIDIIVKISKDLFKIEFNFNFDFNELIKELNFDESLKYKNLISKTLKLNEEIEIINNEIKDIISKKKLSLEGNELLELINSGDLTKLQEKFNSDIKEFIKSKEKELLKDYKDNNLNVNFIFKSYNYPLEFDEEIKNEILENIDTKLLDLDFKKYKRLGNYDINTIESMWNFIYIFDLIFGIKKFQKEYDLKYININNSNGISLINCKNIYLKKPNPINYGIGTNNLNGIKLNNEKIAILTGANSGGKTTLLEMNLQAQILTSIGLGIPADSRSNIRLFDEVIYLKKFTGTIGSGAFEQTIRSLINLLDSNTSKLILIDEFEAVTEPGAAAKILIMFLKEIIKQDTLSIVASHLGKEIEEFIKIENIKEIRIDGISASGLDKNGNLITNHQPEFYKLGKSTPELILKKILQDEKYWKNKKNNSRTILEKIINS